MKNKNTKKYQSKTYSDFIYTNETIFGYDVATLYLNDIVYSGNFDKSPIQDRIFSKFNYVFADESKKGYKAHWMILDSELLLGHVNAQIKNQRLYFYDIFPDFSDEEILHHFDEFSGSVGFIIQEIEAPESSFDSINNFDFLELTFQNGILIKVVQ